MIDCKNLPAFRAEINASLVAKIASREVVAPDGYTPTEYALHALAKSIEHLVEAVELITPEAK